jgi:hypothetical protein
MKIYLLQSGGNSTSPNVLKSPLKVNEIHPMRKFWYSMNCRQNSEKFIPSAHPLQVGKKLPFSLLLVADFHTKF